MGNDNQDDSPTKDEIWDAWRDHRHKFDFTERPEWRVAIYRLGFPDDFAKAVEAPVPIVVFKRAFERVWRNGETFFQEDILGNGEIVSRKYWKEFELRNLRRLFWQSDWSAIVNRSP